ncbi:MAG: DinB family protein [Candidatus Rokubacteria bacterium]|nr:DinB family protein [Candidatus Rokubacteria bacterium]
MKGMLAALYEYGVWANNRLLAKATHLGDDQLGQKLTKGANPILPTFAHLVGADLRWFARWRGETAPTLSVTDFPTLEAVRRRWEELYPVRRAYIASLDGAKLLEPILWVRDEGSVTIPRWQAMLQCANHGTQHRSEIAAMLTDLGHSPGNIDFVLYCLESARA